MSETTTTPPAISEPLPPIKRGLRFLHRRWVRSDLTIAQLKDPTIPAEEKAQLMEVTYVRDGAIYYGWVYKATTGGEYLSSSREYARSEERFRHNVLKYLPSPSKT